MKQKMFFIDFEGLSFGEKINRVAGISFNNFFKIEVKCWLTKNDTPKLNGV